MKKHLFSMFCALIFTSAATAQQVAPTPPKDDDQVIKISTNLIQIDVTVTDKNGKIVTDLKPEDFELFENGERQEISNFSVVDRSVGGVNAGGGAGATGQQGVPSDPANVKASDIRRTIAIVVDDLNLSFGSVFYTRKALTKFVDEQMQPGDLVAIIRTAGGMGALQQFTADKRLLHAAIEKIRWNPFGGSFDQLSPVSQNNSDLSERFLKESDPVASGHPKTFTGTLTRESVADTKRMDYKADKDQDETEQGVYAQTALGVIRYIITGMAKMPGRKSLMLFSDGIDIGADAGKSRTAGLYGLLQDISDAANRSSVVVYTFDTRGLQAMSITASDSTYEIIDGHRGQKEGLRTKDFKESQDGLMYLANTTGGKAQLNSNDLNGGIDRALYDQTGYYLLGYVPDAESFDPAKRKFNKFEVKVKRPGLKASYRSGFFASSPEPPRPNLTVAEREMADSLMSPFAQSDITLGVNALYADDPVDGAYVRAFLHIDAKDLKFSEADDGWKTATFDLAAVMFGDAGVPVESKESKYTIKSKGATFETMMQKGFVYVLIMPIKTPGLYQYRVALRDESSGKIGSAMQVVEIPNLGKQKLTVSSLAVENVTMDIWQKIAAGKVGNNPGQVQVPSSLLYDTVLKRFQTGTVLRYGFEVYNAKADKNSVPQLEVQAKILQSDRAVVLGNPVKFDASGQPDPKHLRISGNMLLNNNLQEGDYVLQIVVTDTLSKQVSTQLFPFEIMR